MGNQLSNQSSSPDPNPGEGQDGRDVRENEAVRDIIAYLTFEPDATTSDQTAERRQNLSTLCLVSKRFRAIAHPHLFKIVHISTVTCLRKFLKTVQSRLETAELVRELVLDLKLCGQYLSGPENLELCKNMYSVLDCTTRLQLLSLDLKLCTCCGAADIKNAGYDRFFAEVRKRAWEELDDKAGSRSFLAEIQEYRFATTSYMDYVIPNEEVFPTPISVQPRHDHDTLSKPPPRPMIIISTIARPLTMPVPVSSAAAEAEDESDRSSDTYEPWSCLDFTERPVQCRAE